MVFSNSAAQRVKPYKPVLIRDRVTLEAWPGYFDYVDSLRNRITRNIHDDEPVSKRGKLKFWIMGLGDSYASGEGNPNNDAHYETPWFLGSGNPGVQWDNGRCRRSSRSGYEKAKDKLKNHDFDSVSDIIDIKLKSFACGGAKTKHLLPMDNGECPDCPLIGEPLQGNCQCLGEEWKMVDPAPVRPQISQMEDFINDNLDHFEQVDVVLLSIGGNDVGFSSAIMVCALGNCDLGPPFDVFSSVCLNFGYLNICKALLSLPHETGYLAALAVANYLDIDLPPDPGYFLNSSTSPLAGPICEGAAILLLELVFKPQLAKGLSVMQDSLRNYYSEIDSELRDLEFEQTNKAMLRHDAIFQLEYINPFYKEDEKLCDPAFEIGNEDWLLGGITIGEVRWLKRNIYDLLIEHIRNNELRFGWNIIELAEGSKRHGMCSDEPYLNLNMEALEQQGADMFPILPISGGVVHPNNRGYEYVGEQIREKLRPRVREKLRVTPDDYPTRPRFVLNTDGGWTFQWNDNTQKERGYFVELYRVSFDEELGTIEVSDDATVRLPAYTDANLTDKDATEFNLSSVRASEFGNVGILLPEKSFDVKVGMSCPDSDNLSNELIYYAKDDWGRERVRVGLRMPSEPELYGYVEEVKVWDGGVTVLFKDTTPQEMGHILAWAKLGEDADTIADLDEYLKNVAINFHFLGEIVHTKPGEGPPLDVHLEISRMYSDSITRALNFYPYENYISEKTPEDQFVVTLKFCNLAGCSPWAPPILVKPPKIVVVS